VFSGAQGEEILRRFWATPGKHGPHRMQSHTVAPVSRRPAEEVARLYFREGEIWFGPTGKNIGCETDGKSREFTRPIIFLKSETNTLSWRFPSRPRRSPNPYRLPIGIVDGRQAFATLSQLPILTASGSSKKIIHLDADILAAIKKEASRVNFG
jgi:hypothetical protein